jgi:hypothetical protein
MAKMTSKFVIWKERDSVPDLLRRESRSTVPVFDADQRGLTKRSLVVRERTPDSVPELLRRKTTTPDV